jgi:hypothetical protein
MTGQRAQRVHVFKQSYGNGRIEGVVWLVPEPVPPSEHPYKYRLVYVCEGKRIVGYDNERGKGDHKHLGEVESEYVFAGVKQLLADFMNDVEANKA